MKYIQTMELEQELHDRCIYVKQNVWEDAFGIRQKPEEILYWFKLDPIPED